MQLVDRRVIVTGGARGIAEAVVRTLVKEGAKVASLDILDEEGEAVVREANAGGPGHASYFHCDVAKREETNRVIDAAVAALGGLDALVNIAGVERTSAAEDIADAEYDFIMDVNMRGTMYTNQAAFRHLKATGGQIVNFGSGAGVRGMPGGAHYSASKGAVLAWSRTVAQEWARYNITVNAVAPGIWTPMYEAHRAVMTPEQLAAHDKVMAQAVLIGGKLGDPMRDLAPVITFLVSDGARFITGQTLPVDGGMLFMT
jgi:NAD(P)-dependent dehydrogenase (short-subunit alcohol dehydrogenase family)